MKKLLLVLSLGFLFGCTNAKQRDEQEIANYIKEIDTKIETEFNVNPRGTQPYTKEELKKIPFSYAQYVENFEENGYMNIYSAATHILLKSFSLGKDKKPYGVYKVFYEDGTLQEIGFIDEGKVNSGTKRVYYPNGKLHKLIPFYKGSLEGERIFYFKNGQIEEIYRYVNNKEEGEGRVNYENGNPKLIEGNK